MSDGERPEHGVTLIAWAGLALAGLALAGLIWRGCTAAPRFHVPAEAGRTLEEADMTVNIEGWLDPEAVEEQARADAIRAEAEAIRAMKGGNNVDEQAKAP